MVPLFPYAIMCVELTSEYGGSQLPSRKLSITSAPSTLSKWTLTHSLPRLCTTDMRFSRKTTPDTKPNETAPVLKLTVFPVTFQLDRRRSTLPRISSQGLAQWEMTLFSITMSLTSPAPMLGNANRWQSRIVLLIVTFCTTQPAPSGSRSMPERPLLEMLLSKMVTLEASQTDIPWRPFRYTVTLTIAMSVDRPPTYTPSPCGALTLQCKIEILELYRMLNACSA
mmetsp:Transcript_26110/g.60268  ORF Transcript_26110/g.60268 Transcript_26110/m.60268 type:complete len:225 (-) Transcript_26110:419-1093(-)